MNRPGFIACDLDGTLLTPDGAITARTAAVLVRIKAAGVPFVPATGRPPRGAREILAHPGLGGPAVCSNGAVLYDYGTDRVISASTIAPRQLRAVVDAALDAAPGCGFAVDRLTPGGVLPLGMLAEPNYRHAWQEPGATLTDLEDLVGEPATKMIVRHTGMTSERLAALLAPLLEGAVEVTYCVPYGVVEIVPGGVTKAVGLARLIEITGLYPGRMLAFGDMPNDIDMLRRAAYSVAMANAHPDVLAIADEVAASNAQDGVARVLERWF